MFRKFHFLKIIRPLKVGEGILKANKCDFILVMGLVLLATPTHPKTTHSNTVKPVKVRINWFHHLECL